MKDSSLQLLQQLLGAQTRSDQVGADERGAVVEWFSGKLHDQIYSHLPRENQKIIDELRTPRSRPRTRSEKELLLDTIRRIRALARLEAGQEEGGPPSG